MKFREKVLSFINLMSNGALGKPKVEVGQKWVYAKEDNPFVEESTSTFIVTHVIGKYVLYNVYFFPGHVFSSRSETVNQFRWIRELVDD